MERLAISHCLLTRHRTIPGSTILTSKTSALQFKLRPIIDDTAFLNMCYIFAGSRILPLSVVAYGDQDQTGRSAPSQYCTVYVESQCRLIELSFEISVLLLLKLPLSEEEALRSYQPSLPPGPSESRNKLKVVTCFDRRRHKMIIMGILQCRIDVLTESFGSVSDVLTSVFPHAAYIIALLEHNSTAMMGSLRSTMLTGWRSL